MLNTMSTSTTTTTEIHLHPTVCHYHLKSHKQAHDLPNNYHTQPSEQLLWTPGKNCLTRRITHCRNCQLPHSTELKYYKAHRQTHKGSVIVLKNSLEQ